MYKSIGQKYVAFHLSLGGREQMSVYLYIYLQHCYPVSPQGAVRGEEGLQLLAGRTPPAIKNYN